ncbi:M15 family peptidase [Endozoicomonas sp. SM1973]|uniref:M15 family peptidase n=1 Tax=Spartinivicinus marinus TaxID=2994442 RepID=A0A853IEL6_9GAMM|nr:M15 family peptidase [Spartinivicinus marinus]MCX4025068.1 hypothetical protein [Spartinivicinus marinus]NYZ68978.1 M15 family peptidase [Spartinivicinus marinus]
MPKFSPTSLERLATCHEDLQVLFSEIIKDCDCSILIGHRNQQDQDVAYVAGKSTLLFPHSKHNRLPAFAVDVAPYPIKWEEYNQFYYLGGLVVGTAIKLFKEGRMKHRLRWGGDWNRNHQVSDQTFNDLVHFELVEGDDG